MHLQHDSWQQLAPLMLPLQKLWAAAGKAMQQLWFTLFSETINAINYFPRTSCLMNHWAINLNSRNVYSQSQYCLNNPQGNN